MGHVAVLQPSAPKGSPGTLGPPAGGWRVVKKRGYMRSFVAADVEAGG